MCFLTHKTVNMNEKKIKPQLKNPKHSCIKLAVQLLTLKIYETYMYSIFFMM